MFDLPDFLGDELVNKLEKEVLNTFLSTAYSAWITAMWRSGSSKWAQYIGEGKAMQDAATAAYLSLRVLEQKGIALTVPQDMLEANNLSRFQTQSKG